MSALDDDQIIAWAFPALNASSFIAPDYSKSHWYTCSLCDTRWRNEDFYDAVYRGHDGHNRNVNRFIVEFDRARQMLERCIAFESKFNATARVETLSKLSWKRNVQASMFRFVIGIPQGLENPEENHEKSHIPPPIELLQRYEGWGSCVGHNVVLPAEFDFTGVEELVPVTLHGLDDLTRQHSVKAVRDFIDRAAAEVLHWKSVPRRKRQSRLVVSREVYEAAKSAIGDMVQKEKREFVDKIVQHSFQERTESHSWIERNETAIVSRRSFNRNLCGDDYRYRDMAKDESILHESSEYHKHMETLLLQKSDRLKAMSKRCLRADALVGRMEQLTNPAWKHELRAAMFRFMMGPSPLISEVISDDIYRRIVQRLEQYESWDRTFKKSCIDDAKVESLAFRVGQLVDSVWRPGFCTVLSQSMTGLPTTTSEVAVTEDILN